MQPAEAVISARLVDRHDDRKIVYARELEILRAAPGRDVDDPGSLLHRDLIPGDDAVLDTRCPGQLIERSLIAPADEFRSRPALDVDLVGIALDRNPLPVLLEAVLLLRMNRGGDVRGQRPGRGRPDRERLAGPVEEGSGRRAKDRCAPRSFRPARAPR